MSSLLHNLLLALIPVVAAGVCILALKRAVPALLLVLLPLASIVMRAHCVRGLPFEPILLAYKTTVGASIFTVLLLGAGVALINNGPARGYARRLVGLIHDPVHRLLAGILIGAITGFGSSSMAAQFLADLFAEGQFADGQKEGMTAHAAQNLALAVGTCTFGSLLVPFSVWWIYFIGNTVPNDDNPHPALRIAASGWFYAMPALFCVSLTLLLAHAQWQRNAALIRQRDVRFLLRLPSAPPQLHQGVTWGLFFAILIFYPLLAAGRFGPNEWRQPAGILLATLAASLWWLIQDCRGSVQTLWPLPETEDATTEDAANALAQLRRAVPAALPARERRSGLGLQVLPDRAAAAATHLILPTTRRSAALPRLQLALDRQWRLWDQGISGGLSTVLVFLTAIVFRIFYTDYLTALNVHLNFGVVGTLLHRPHPWLWHMAGCMVLVVVLGAIGGYFIGTAFGTFALVFSLAQPTLDHMARVSTVASHYAQMLVGLLIAVAAAINSCSPQADNVNVVSKHLRISPDQIAGAVRMVLIKALLITLALGLILPALLH